MKAKQQARLVRHVGNPELVSATLVSDRETSGGFSRHDMEYQDVRIFLPEVAFGVIEHDLDQHSGLLSTVRVLQQGHLDGGNGPPTEQKVG